MIVHVNKNLTEFDNAWECLGSRKLKIVNTTGKHGRTFPKVFLAYKRMGRVYYIFINKHRNKEPKMEKICGIWVSDSDYEVKGKEEFTGKTKDGDKICGRFGIYDVGTVITCNDVNWILKENGWRIMI